MIFRSNNILNENWKNDFRLLRNIAQEYGISIIFYISMNHLGKWEINYIVILNVEDIFIINKLIRSSSFKLWIPTTEQELKDVRFFGIAHDDQMANYQSKSLYRYFLENESLNNLIQENGVRYYYLDWLPNISFEGLSSIDDEWEKTIQNFKRIYNMIGWAKKQIHYGLLMGQMVPYDNNLIALRILIKIYDNKELELLNQSSLEYIGQSGWQETNEQEYANSFNLIHYKEEELKELTLHIYQHNKNPKIYI